MEILTPVVYAGILIRPEISSVLAQLLMTAN